MRPGPLLASYLPFTGSVPRRLQPRLRQQPSGGHLVEDFDVRLDGPLVVADRGVEGLARVLLLSGTLVSQLLFRQQRKLPRRHSEPPQQRGSGGRGARPE